MRGAKTKKPMMESVSQIYGSLARSSGFIKRNPYRHHPKTRPLKALPLPPHSPEPVNGDPPGGDLPICPYLQLQLQLRGPLLHRWHPGINSTPSPSLALRQSAPPVAETRRMAVAQRKSSEKTVAHVVQE